MTTKEELEKEAKTYAEEHKMDMIDYHDSLFMEDAYIASAEPRERRIKELEAANIELQKLVQQREQRGLEVQEDLLREKYAFQQDNIVLKRKLETLLEILHDRDTALKELRRSVAQITEPVVDRVLEQEARDWIRHNHELVDWSDFHDEVEYDHARVDDLVEVYVAAVKAHMKKEQVDEVQ